MLFYKNVNSSKEIYSFNGIPVKIPLDTEDLVKRNEQTSAEFMWKYPTSRIDRIS